MSNATTRSQYAYIEVKRDSRLVALYGPTEVLTIIQRNLGSISSLYVESFGSTTQLAILRSSNITFSKVAFVEEILKHGFAYDDTPSSIKDDFIIFSRQVKL